MITPQVDFIGKCALPLESIRHFWREILNFQSVRSEKGKKEAETRAQQLEQVNSEQRM